MSASGRDDRGARFQPVQGPLRYVLLVVAWVSLALGLIGLVTPMLPTVPFIILASWAGMRSSQRVHDYLESHRIFGPILRDWREHGAVRRRTKAVATLSMVIGAAVLWWMSPTPWIAASVSALMACVAIWLWLRPEPPVWR
jgi:uncharacterized membrane protein YbaN (DUF454 family)